MKIFKISPYIKVYLSRRIAVTASLGFSSGLPLALTGGTLQAWMAVEGVDITTIGVFALIGLPYSLKFLWSPFMDRYSIPLLGRRRGWILICQICIMIALGIMSFCSPQKVPFLLALIAVFIAFISASQDIVIDAYRTDVLREEERGAGAAVFVFGYRIALFFSGALALIISEYINWHNTYLLVASGMLIGIVSIFMAPEPDVKAVPPKSLSDAVVNPLRDFFIRPNALLILLLIILYKLGDAYAGSLTTAFLIRGVGFTVGDVGTINKGFGLICAVMGSFIGGALMVKLGLMKSLLFFGILQAISNLSFMWLAFVGKSYEMLIFTIAFENLSGGMGTSAFVALLMSLCNKSYSATQYALLSSLAAVGRIIISPTSGFLVESVGWANFFLITTLVATPALVLLWHMREDIRKLSLKSSQEGNK
ncbi:MAG: MFS transporter [Thermodesulfovibrionales bacterium]|nr:MFS transporter [Thermodesulfovibrionales bacterium]